MAGVINRPEVLALFARQHWVASRRQLTELGVSTSAIDRARGRGVVVSPVSRRACRRRRRAVVRGAGDGRAARRRGHRLRQRAVRRRAVRAARDAEAAPRGDDEGAARGGDAEAAPARRGRHGSTRRATSSPVPTGCASRRRCGCCSGWPSSSTSTASSGPPRMPGSSGSSRPTQAGDYLAAIRRSGRTGVIRWKRGWRRLSFIERPAQSGSGAGLRRDDRPRRPADTGAAAPAPPRQRRARSTSTWRGRRHGWPSSPVTPGGTRDVDAQGPGARPSVLRRRVAGRALRPGMRGTTSGAPRSRSWRSTAAASPISAVLCRVLPAERAQLGQNPGRVRRGRR